MKKIHDTDRTSTNAMRWIALSSLSLIPTVASAVDWTGTTGSFGTGTNWDGGVVPSATSANIANSGTASITTADAFGVTVLTVGGHAGVGAITQDGGSLTTTKIIVGGDDAGGGTGQGIYTISGGCLSGTGNQEMWVGSKGGTGTLNMSGASTITNNNVGSPGTELEFAL